MPWLPSWRELAKSRDQKATLWSLLASEHQPWLAHLAHKYGQPATQLARTLTPADLQYEIAAILAETARTTAARLLAEENSDDEERTYAAQRELLMLEERRDILSRTTLAIYRRLDAERQAREDEEADAELTRYMRMQAQ